MDTVGPHEGQRCNIGPAEVSRRRWVATTMTVATVGVAVLLVLLAAPHPARVLLWPVAAGTGVSWLQVTNRFCVRFGALGVQNLGPLGAEHAVRPEDLAADRRRAATLITQGALAGLVATAAFVVLPV